MNCDCYYCQGLENPGSPGTQPECEYFNHHCPDCHEKKLCTAPDCLEGKRMAFNETVHHVGYSSQHDVQFTCDETWGWHWMDPPGLPQDVHVEDGGKYYSFEWHAVTCAECLAKKPPKVAEEETVNDEETIAFLRKCEILSGERK